MRTVLISLLLIPLLSAPAPGLAKSKFNPLAEKTIESKVKGCEKGDAGQCFAAGQDYRFGKNVPRNLELAEKYFSLGCRGGSKYACKALYDLGYVYHLGKNYLGKKIPKDRARAKRIWELGCASGHGLACTALGSVYEKGQVVKKDMAKALELYMTGCEGRSARGCRKAGDLTKDKDPATALAFYEKACRWKDSRACAGIGLLYLRGRGVAQDYALAAEYLTRSCDKSPGKNASAGCLALGDLYQAGLGVPRDEAEAFRYYRLSCMYHHTRQAEGCYKMARAYQTGQGVEPNPNSANNYYRVACRSGLEKGCVEQYRDECERLKQPRACQWLKKHGYKK